MKERHARFRVVEARADVVIIRDVGPWDRFLTVTNDAENVVESLAPALKGRRLWYYDSEGALDELVVKNGQFACFAPLSSEEIASAPR